MDYKLTTERLSDDDLEFIEGALHYDIERLETLDRRYQTARNNVRNTDAKAMADEGQAASRVRIARYRDIIEKLRVNFPKPVERKTNP